MDLSAVCFLVFLGLVSSTPRFARHIRPSGPPCPEEWDITPCTCRGPAGVPTLDCSDVPDEDNLTRIFQSSPVQMNLRGVDIHNNENIKNLQGETFGTHTIHLFLLEDNKIESVSNFAFKGSEETATLIRLNNNELKSFPFDSLPSLKSLQVLQVSSNKIGQIPPNAFKNSNLEAIDFSNNLLTTIGKDAIAEVPKLGKLDLSGNKLTTIGEKAFANDQLSTGLNLNLANNSISEIDDTAFTGLKISTLDFSNNELNTLKESVFAPILKDNPDVELILEGNQIDCDSDNMKWFQTLTSELKTKVKSLRC